jgi:hypothetical protein
MTAREHWACQVPGCDATVQRKATARWCWRHYLRWRRHGDPAADLRAPPGTRACTFDGCAKPWKAHRLCAGHRSQRQRGRPLAPLRDRQPHNEPGAACGIDSCARPSVAHQLCRLHYERQQRGLPLEPVALPGRRQPGPGRMCTVPDCLRSARYALFCTPHYRALVYLPRQVEAAGRTRPGGT